MHNIICEFCWIRIKQSEKRVIEKNRYYFHVDCYNNLEKYFRIKLLSLFKNKRKPI